MWTLTNVGIAIGLILLMVGLVLLIAGGIELLDRRHVKELVKAGRITVPKEQSKYGETNIGGHCSRCGKTESYMVLVRIGGLACYREEHWCQDCIDKAGL